jgi:hypothetical protein
MTILTEVQDFDFTNLPLSDYWSDESDKELSMHRIHAYPAKFPYFLVSKAIDFANTHEVNIRCLSDSFCGCGTTALESRRRNIDFWGYDINPVATLIARVKSEQYEESLLNDYYKEIITFYKTEKTEVPGYIADNVRLRYWFREESIFELSGLLNAVKNNVPNG